MNARAHIAGALLSLLILAPAIGASTSEPAPVDSIQVANQWYRDHRWEDAEALLRRLLSRFEATHGPTSSEVGKTLDVLVSLLRRTGRRASEETHDLALRAIALKEELYGPDHLEIARSLVNLGIIYAGTRRYAESDSIFQRVRAIREAALPEGHGEIVYAIALQGTSREGAGDLPGAIALYEEAIGLAEARGDSASSDVNVARINLGHVYAQMGRYAEAREIFDRLIALLRGSGSSTLAAAMHDRAKIAQSTGDHRGALTRFQDALDLAEELHGPLAPVAGQIRNNMAKSLIYLERFSEARELLDRQIALLEPNGPSRSLALAYGKMARLSNGLGDHREELYWQRRSLELMRSIYPESHTRVAEALFILGYTYGALKRWDEQKEAIEQAAAIFDERYGDSNPWRGFALSALSANALARGDRVEARRLLEAAIENHIDLGSDDTPRYAEILVDLARLDVMEGRADDACGRIERALEIAGARLGRDNPRLGTYGVELAGAQRAAGRSREAFESALEAHRILHSATRYTIRTLPQRQALRFAAQLVRSLDRLVSLVDESGDPEATRKVWEALIASRAVVLDELAARNREFDASDPELRQRMEAYRQACTRMANLFVDGDAGDSESFPALIEDARRDMEEAERRLRSLEGSGTAPPAPGLDELRAHLPPRHALVALCRIADRDSTDFRYRGFVLGASGADPISVDLGDGAHIDSLVAAWRREAGQGALRSDRDAGQSLDACNRAGRALRQAVWDPLAEHMGPVDGVFFVPAGQLHLVNLSALMGEDGSYLIESGPVICTLTTERKLPDVVVRRRVPIASGAEAHLLILGAPDFDALSSAPGDAALSADADPDVDLPPFRGAAPACLDLRSRHFLPLSGSLDEAREITRLWQTRWTDASQSATLLKGVEASEGAFKRLAGGCEAIHLATHGFVLDPECRVEIEGARGIGVLVAETPDTSVVPAPELDPLLSSGLALAGANRRDDAGPGEEDGILTAQEIAALNLSASELAVLSACDTGTGTVLNGEGVFGLRRAFAMAGVTTLVTSLWSVRDEATREWMGSFYEALLRDRLDPFDAVRAASLSMLRQRRARGDDPHPFYWAAFVASGE